MIAKRDHSGSLDNFDQNFVSTGWSRRVLVRADRHPTPPLRFCQDTQPDKAIVLEGKTFKTLEAEQSQISSRTSNICYALSEPVLTLIAQPFSAPVLLLSL